MEQDNDLKYFMRVEQVQHLLAVYGIEDCEPSGKNPYLLATTEPHTLSKIIHVGLGSVLRTQDLAFSKEVHDEYEELLEVMQLHDFLKSCLGSKITINGTITQQGQSKGFNSEILIPFGQYNRVSVKSFKTREEAKAALASLKSKLDDPGLWILKR